MRIFRSCKTAKIRNLTLEDLVISEKVAKVVPRGGDGILGDLKTRLDEVWFSLQRTGAGYTECLITATEKMALASRVLISWAPSLRVLSSRTSLRKVPSRN